ncbi:hypothetical protein ACWC5I_27690 [Kitasatospora sp. NPDC001574]
MGTPAEFVFVYDIDFVLAELETCASHQAPDRRTLRVSVVDPHPEPGYGPALGAIHKALREALRISDPTAYESIQSPGDLTILKLRAPEGT